MGKICQPVDRFQFRFQWLCKFLRTKKKFLLEKSVQLPLGLFLTLDLLGSIIGEVSKM